MATKVNNQQGLAIVIENNVSIVEVKGSIAKSVKTIIQRKDELWDSIKDTILDYAINEKSMENIEKDKKISKVLDKEAIRICINLARVKGNLEIIDSIREYKMTEEKNGVLTIVK